MALSLSLVSIKSRKVSKMYFIVKRPLNPMHTGGSSPFNKKEWVIQIQQQQKGGKGQCAIGLWQFSLFCFKFGNTLCSLFLGELIPVLRNERELVSNLIWASCRPNSVTWRRTKERFSWWFCVHLLSVPLFSPSLWHCVFTESLSLCFHLLSVTLFSPSLCPSVLCLCFTPVSYTHLTLPTR